MENDRIAKRFYIGECAFSSRMGRPRKMRIDTMKDCLKERGLDIRKVSKWSKIGRKGGGL